MREHHGQSPYNGEVPTSTFVKTEKAEDRTPPGLAAIPCMMINKPPQNRAKEECRWGPHCPLCTKSTPNPKAESTEDWNGNRQDKEWNERVECLNDKYNLDYYSSSGSNSESESEHKYETLM